MVLNDEAVITHELTIKENADGSFMYMGNKILDDGIKKFLVINIESAFLMLKRIWIESNFESTEEERCPASPFLSMFFEDGQTSNPYISVK